MGITFFIYTFFIYAHFFSETQLVHKTRTWCTQKLTEIRLTADIGLNLTGRICSVFLSMPIFNYWSITGFTQLTYFTAPQAP